MSGFYDWIGENIPDNIMEDAASWMALLDSGSCTPADRLTFARWLNEDPRHQGAFEELSEIWARLRTLSDVPVMIEHPDVIPFPVEREVAAFDDEVQAASKGEWSALAASLLIIFGIISHWAFGTPSDLHVTQTGEIQIVSMVDGSRIELNSRSMIEVKIDDKRREIRLTRGEALFHVQKSDRPFIVHTELATISAVGTTFSVRTDSSVVEISVVEGLVSVAATNSGIALTEYDDDLLFHFTDSIALLGAGQRLELTREGMRYQVVSKAMLDDDLSWRNGEVVFSDTPLVAAIARMRRHHEVRILIGDPILNGLRISGRFPIDDADYFLADLQERFGIAIDRNDPNYVVLRPD